METHPPPRIVFAERLDDSVVVTFDDGRCALYSAALLLYTFDQAQELFEETQGFFDEPGELL